MSPPSMPKPSLLFKPLKPSTWKCNSIPCALLTFFHPFRGRFHCIPKWIQKKRVSSPFLSIYNNEIPFSELSGWYPLPDQFMNIGLECNPPPFLAWIAYRVRKLCFYDGIVYFLFKISKHSHSKGLTFSEQIYQVSKKKILACWA